MRRRRAASTFLFASVFACVALVTLAAQSAPASTTLAEARKLIDAGKPAEAIARLRQGDAGDPRVAQLLGVAYYHAGDAARAIETLSAVLPRLAAPSTERTEAVQVLGLSHYLAGHIAESIPFLEEVRATAPDDMKLAYALAMAYAQTRQPGKARASIARTFKVADDSASAYLLTGQLMNRLELEDLAVASLKEALARDPRLPEAHFLLGQIAVFRSRLDEGLALLRAELAINPAHGMALYWIGEVHSRQSKWPEAIAALQQSIWINPYFSAPYILLGKAYSKTAQPATAEEMFRRAIQYDPNNKTAHYLLGQLLQQAGRIEEAQKELAIAARLQGDIK